MKKEVLVKLINDNYSIPKLAKELNKGKSTIHYWLKKYGIKTKYKKYNKGTKKPFKCYKCGETQAEKFYGHKRSICGHCHYLYVMEFRIKQKERSIAYKRGECISCGYKKCIDALEFHHTDPSQKDPNWSSMIRGGAWENLRKELDKCDLLCSNCHRELHWNLNQKIGI